MKHTVLIVDDEVRIHEVLKEALASEPYYILTSSSAKEALDILCRQLVNVVISDEKMPGMPGSEFLAIVRKKYPDTIRIMLTGYANLDTAIRSINEGEIYRFFRKPFNLVDLAITIRQALQLKALEQERQRLKETVSQQSAIIDDIEREFPGITKLRKNEAGAIIIDDQISEVTLARFFEQKK
jgi:DNA-binding NtrC family response regulator